MKSMEIDVRGLSCPQPVLRTKQALMSEGVEVVYVLVDDETSKENIIRFIESRGWKAKENPKTGTEVVVEIKK